MNDKIKKLLFQIYDNDKTPPYGYGQGKDSFNGAGNHAGIGKRWQTPKEIIRNHIGESEFWKGHNEYRGKINK